jgi:glycosyltransferase involved in cell wall biosynthesis
MHKPKVLYLTSRMPSPPLSGGQLREYNLIKRLGGDFRIHLCVATMFPDICSTGVPELEDHCESVRLYDAESPAGRPDDVPLRVWQQRSARMKEDLRKTLLAEDFDLVHVEGYYMTQYLRDLPPRSCPPVMLVEENIEYLIDQQWEQSAEGSGPSKSWRAAVEMERAAWRRAAACGVVSEDDLHHIRRVAPEVHPLYVPHGCDHLDLLPPGATRPADAAPHGEPTAVFVGDYTYPPSHDAAVFLGTEIWPRVTEHHATARLLLAGRGATAEMRQLAAGRDRLHVVGFVESVRDTLDTADIFVCPLRVGGGVKLKMLEAVARGVPTVTTAVGAQGLPHSVTAHMEVHDDPRAFADAVVSLLNAPELRVARSRNQRSAAKALPTWNEAARAVRDAWRSLADPERQDPPRGLPVSPEATDATETTEVKR